MEREVVEKVINSMTYTKNGRAICDVDLTFHMEGMEDIVVNDLIDLNMGFYAVGENSICFDTLSVGDPDSDLSETVQDLFIVIDCSKIISIEAGMSYSDADLDGDTLMKMFLKRCNIKRVNG